MEKQKLVVIGNGMAGARFVEETLARGGADRFDITMFGDEPCGNYNRIPLFNVLAGSHDPDDILINPLPWYERNGVKLHAGVRAGWIDRISKAVYAAAGISESYDKLVIATGSTPYIPPAGRPEGRRRRVEGRSIHLPYSEDCRKLTDCAGTARKVAVIGGGLLGLEAAGGLLARGSEVHVVHISPYLMDTQLDRESGRMLKSIMEDLGVNIHLERWTVNVLGDQRVSGLAFREGDPVDCKMVVVAGVRPNVDLAKQAGLQVQHGIIVKDDLSCRNNSDVYAIGECAQHRGQLYGVVAPLWDQAEILAQRLTEENPDATFRGAKVSTKLKVMGDNEPLSEEDELVHYSEPSRGVYKKLIIREGRLAGAILLGGGMTTPGVLQSCDRGQLLPQNRAEFLFPTSAAAKVMDPADLLATAQICACNGVSKGRIAEDVQNGQDTFKAVCEATRAGSGSGTRKGQVQAVLDHALSALVADSSPAPALTLLEPALPGQD